MARNGNRPDPVTGYADGVISGKIVASRWVRLACERHLDDLRRAKDRKAGIRWDLDICAESRRKKEFKEKICEHSALYAIGFFKDVLRLNGGQFEGKPFVLEAFEAFIVGSLFGWKLADGTRRYQMAYVEMAKVNGKSPLAAGIGMKGLVADGEARAEIYAAAT